MKTFINNFGEVFLYLNSSKLYPIVRMCTHPNHTCPWGCVCIVNEYFLLCVYLVFERIVQILFLAISIIEIWVAEFWEFNIYHFIVEIQDSVFQLSILPPRKLRDANYAYI